MDGVPFSCRNGIIRGTMPESNLKTLAQSLLYLLLKIEYSVVRNSPIAFSHNSSVYFWKTVTQGLLKSCLRGVWASYFHKTIVPPCPLSSGWNSENDHATVAEPKNGNLMGKM
ncbi:hypothetical protein CEXT_102271 [Caerostris extrusa]|uniref:Uncharacterized protein n=1 Tax=Caerostris extrusa TaxID=172846 RepID=A0AAV4TFS9_CAEEX|nr:hypothetical protein CEXT_102271 [Caerostris extrusa]